MRTHASTLGTLARPAGPAGLVARLTGLLDLVDRWLARRRQRLDLQELDPRMLKDLGLTPADVAREAGKPFWQP